MSNQNSKKKKGTGSSFSEEEKILRRIPIEILILSLIIALASLTIFDPLTALFIFTGGAFSALSFTWLKQTISKFLLPVKKKALRSALAFYSIRLVLILGIFFIIIFFFSRKILAFVGGFSTIVPVFMVEAIIALSKMKKWKD